jgi:hypothetical protein
VLSIHRDEDESTHPRHRGFAMVEAIVLVQVKVGRSSAVAQAVGEIGGSPKPTS